jgi:c-di-GMP-binding flagellar brake protein YcgR
MDFIINNKAEIFSMENKRIGISLIQDYDEKNFYISIPMGKGVRKSLAIGQKVKLIYYEETRLVSFMGDVVEMKKDNIILYKLRQPKKFEVVQRREDFRLPIVLDMKYLTFKSVESVELKKLKIDKIEERFKDDFKKCLSFDLSGQGIGLAMDENIAIGEVLVLVIRHSTLDVVLKGHVVHKVKILRGNGRKYRVGVCFFEQDYRTKEKIVSYIFEKMREQLKRRV